MVLSEWRSWLTSRGERALGLNTIGKGAKEKEVGTSLPVGPLSGRIPVEHQEAATAGSIAAPIGRDHWVRNRPHVVLWQPLPGWAGAMSGWREVT